jgi:hypothetical protein
MGNKQAVAAEHYLQVTEAAFQRGAESGAVALQNAVQSASAPTRTEPHEQQKNPGKTGVFCGITDNAAGEPLPPRGLEPLS